MSDHKVDRASLFDAPIIAARLYEAFEAEDKKPLTEDEKKAILLSILNAVVRPQFIVLTAKVSRRGKMHIVGVVVTEVADHPYGGRVAWGRHLYVQPAYRKSGIAKQLVMETERWVRANGATDFYIESTFPKFFKPLGFEYERAIVKKHLDPPKENEVEKNGESI